MSDLVTLVPTAGGGSPGRRRLREPWRSRL